MDSKGILDNPGVVQSIYVVKGGRRKVFTDYPKVEEALSLPGFTFTMASEQADILFLMKPVTSFLQLNK